MRGFSSSRPSLRTSFHGSALFKDPDGLKHAVADLRERAEAART